MQNVPPTTLLLWLSLALDTDEGCPAQRLMLNLIKTGPCSHSNSSSTSNGMCLWTRRQYLTLLHLYVIEVLLPALRDPSEVRLWLQRQSFLPLDPRERQFLEDEVEMAAATATASTSGGGNLSANCDNLRRRVDCSYMPTTPGDMDAGSRGSGTVLSEDGGGGREGEDLSVHSGITRRHGPDLGLSPVPSPLPFGPTEPTSPAGRARWRWQQPQQGPESGINSTSGRLKYKQQQDTAGGDEAVDAVAELDWLGSAQQAGFKAAMSLYQQTYAAAGRALQTIYPSAAANKNDTAATSSSSQAVPPLAPSAPQFDASSAAGAVAAVVVAYAAYSERDFLGRAANKAWRGVWRGLGDLMGTGLSFNPNPMQTTMRGRLG